MLLTQSGVKEAFQHIDADVGSIDMPHAQILGANALLEALATNTEEAAHAVAAGAFPLSFSYFA
jgi:hypothetical protein